MPLVRDKYGRAASGLDQASPPPGDWGVLKVYCGTTDVTSFRGVPTTIERYGYTEPFWYGPAAIAFPQIGPHDLIGGTDIPWWKQGMNVTIKRLLPDNTTEIQVWEGFAGSWNPVMDDDGYRMRFECTGALHQTMLEPYPPRFSKDAVDIGQAIADAMNTQLADKFGPLPVVNTGILTRNRGSWQSRFDYISELLATAYTADGVGQWTLKCSPGRFPFLELKNTTTRKWTVTNGYYGVKLNVASDMMASTTTIFGEGQEPDGCRWRNSRYDAPGTLPTFRPLALVTENEQFVYDERGRIIGQNPAFDPYKMRVARYVNYGTGVTQAEATRSAEAELRRDVNPGWYGNLELKVDPEEGSRMDIRAGDNIGVRYHHSDGITLFHVSAVDHAFSKTDGIVTTLTVDTNTRDDLVILSLQQRNREAAKDPRRNLNPPRQKSKNTPDERTVFDCENKAGFMPSTSHAGGSWHVVPIPAGDYGQIVRTEFTTVASKVKFAMGIFSKRPAIATLDALVGNPLSQEAPWDAKADELTAAGLLIAWGSSMEAMGYYPGTQQKDSPITGRFLDGQTWDYFSDDVPWLYVAFYLAGAGNISGRLTPGVED